MNAKAVWIVVMVATLATGCRDAAQQVKIRRLTVDLLRSLSDMEMQLANEEDSLKFLDIFGRSSVEQTAIIENARKRVGELRTDVYKHSDYEHPLIDQIRYEELDHQKLQERLKKIREDHDKGMKRVKEQTRFTATDGLPSHQLA